MTSSLDTHFPKVFDHYILMDLVASGGMGQVFQAVTLDEIGRVVVVKKTFEHFRTDSSYVRMFRDEIKVLSLLNHPNIVHMYNHGAHGEYLEMEFVRGLSLHQILEVVERQSQKIPIEIATYICHEAAKALSYAHELRDDSKSMPLEIVHRDISPHNIMVTYKGGVKVLDFGISKFSDKVNVTEVGVVKGKRNYISPEQNRGQNVGPAADIYSLGAVFWRLLTGRPAFDADNPEEYAKTALKNNIAPPSKYNPQVPRSLDKMISKALDALPENRYRTMADFQAELLSISKEVNRENSIVRKTSEWMQQTFRARMVSDEEALRNNLQKALLLSKEIVDKREQTVPLPQSTPAKGANSDELQFKINVKYLGYGSLALLVLGLFFIRPTGFLTLISRSTNSEIDQPTNNSNVLSDLQLLAEQGLFDEVLAGLNRVSAQQRLASWRDLVVRSVSGYAAVLAKTKVETAFDFLVSSELKYPFLVENKTYRELRQDVATKWFEWCAPNRLDCVDILVPFISSAPENSDFAFKIGHRATYFYFHYSALPFFKVATDSEFDKHICSDDRLKSAVENGSTYEKNSQIGKLAREVAEKCNIKIKD